MPETKEWFENWFDSPYYPILYQNRSITEAAYFVDNLLKFLNPPVPSKLLDIACGEGRFAKQLASYGHDVVGIDLSPTGIENAKQMETEHLQFFIHDMRFPFYINYFDYAFNFFTSFGYFNHQRDHLLAAQAFSSALKPNGILVIDYLNKTKAMAELIPQETVRKGGFDFQIQRYLEHGRFIKEIDFLDEQGNKRHFKEKVAAFGLEDFQHFFAATNMSLQQVFGDYHLNGFNEKESPRLIMIFKKNEDV